ncbi:transporter [Ammoniphilus oxalaticus]|uniref:Transporter n=1 Tax=Ammoniphilus oxalaticus TaxID=66863 RepID=A0A419SKB6_9BACL|nr:EamA family transporter RarD [Ammoniphilus oxalaticus]RKD24422.1 transporter [Ammoniphilus oxalaticus]
MSEERKGIWYAIGAYILWGILAIYWKSLQDIPAGEILAHRVFWSFLFVGVVLFISKRIFQVKAVLSSRRNWITVTCSGFLISANWFTYIWAVNNDHVIEASLGYYINPLFSFALGVLVLKEGLRRWQAISMLFAAVGVTILTIEYGKFPWIALSLALTFAFYGLTKKMIELDSLIALGLETLMVFPVAFFYLFRLELNGTSSLSSISLPTFLLLASSGVITAVPLLWFAQAAKRIPYTMISFIQYVSPTITLLLGIFLYKETFTWTHLISFGFIWLALALYTITSHGSFGQKNKMKDSA